MDLSNDNVIHVKKDGVEFLQFRRLLEFPNIKHAYTLGTDVDFRLETKDGNALPNDEKEIALKNYDKVCKAIGSNYKRLVNSHQTHTDNVKIIQEKFYKNSPDINLEEYNDVDGFITNKKNILLSTRNADCILMLFFDPKKEVIANVHSGWKGTYQEISIKTVEKMMKNFASKPKDIICCICPSIRKCHFEVEKDVKDMFYNKFNYLKEINEFIEEKTPNKKWNIDTALINKIILKQIGLQNENIIDSGICSVCNKKLIHSYRVEKEKYGKETALIEIR